MKRITSSVNALAAMLLVGVPFVALPGCDSDGGNNGNESVGAVFTMSNAAGQNQVIAFGREEDGTLTEVGRFDTGGAGLGEVRFGSQGTVTLT